MCSLHAYEIYEPVVSPLNGCQFGFLGQFGVIVGENWWIFGSENENRFFFVRDVSCFGKADEISFVGL